MKIKFLGVGGAFSPISKGNSNMIFTSDSGKKLLLDFGTTAPYIMRDEWGIDAREIDGVYISHLHADHIGGLEFFAFSRFFQPKKDKDGNHIRPKLFCVPELMQELWETSLRGGLESLEGRVMSLTDYFECITVKVNESFIWEGYRFFPVQTIHVMSGYKFKNSYGLVLKKFDSMSSMYDAFITTDTQYCPYQLHEFYNRSKVIFHDTETLPFKSHVHAHYDDLKTLPENIKNKMWCYHYADKISTVNEDGFLGFVEKGQEFEL